MTVDAGDLPRKKRAPSVTLVSVVIPTFDRPALVPEAIASALAQTHREIEVIVVLNGATDETAEKVKKCGAQPRVRVVETKRANLAAARNYGMSLARGEWIAFLDDDDIWLPEKIELQLAAARASGADLVSCDFVKFDEHGDIPGTGLAALPEGLGYAEALMLENYLSGGSAAMVRAAAIRSLGGFDARLKACEDWDMWRRLAWDGSICHVDRVLVKYRQHGTNMTANHSLMIAALVMHFAKLLEDTPPRLHHMFPAAKYHFFQTLRFYLAAEGVPLHASLADRVGQLTTTAIRGVFRVADKLSFGLARATFERMSRRAQRNPVA
jgi:glycosyltransferase involved in cell wall biosynthesis